MLTNSAVRLILAGKEVDHVRDTWRLLSSSVWISSSPTPERVERTCNILKRVLGGEEVSGDELKAAQEHCLDLLRARNKARPLITCRHLVVAGFIFLYTQRYLTSILIKYTLETWLTSLIIKNLMGCLEHQEESAKASRDRYRMRTNFSDPQKRIFYDRSHSTGKENLFILIGSTDVGRVLTIAFTIRNNRIRVISARDLNRKERYSLTFSISS